MDLRRVPNSKLGVWISRDKSLRISFHVNIVVLDPLVSVRGSYIYAPHLRPRVASPCPRAGRVGSVCWWDGTVTPPGGSAEPLSVEEDVSLDSDFHTKTLPHLVVEPLVCDIVRIDMSGGYSPLVVIKGRAVVNKDHL